jgi:methionyl-tRNA formyltransferase
MRIACVGYRDWALNIYDRLANTLDDVFLIFRTKEQYNENVLKDFKPDLVLYYGWSWFVPEHILKDYKCLMLHPSPLPKYRGGSPIQNQIIAGEIKSKVSIFIMNDEMDAGDILAQDDLSLKGSLHDIFIRIEDVGARLTGSLFESAVDPSPQDHSKATYCKRRKPEESEITLEEIKNAKAEYLFDKIRMLADPYPNAFIRTIDGRKLVIKEAEIKEGE